MIRHATKYDKTEIIKMMCEFRDEAEFHEVQGQDTIESTEKLLDTIFAGAGVVFYEEGKGLLMGIILPSIWCDKIMVMHELAWYVRKEHRNTSLGYRLFVSYMNYGKLLKEQGRIKYFTMTKLDSSPALKYEKYGFRKKDENWIQ